MDGAKEGSSLKEPGDDALLSLDGMKSDIEFMDVTPRVHDDGVVSLESSVIYCTKPITTVVRALEPAVIEVYSSSLVRFRFLVYSDWDVWREWITAFVMPHTSPV